MIKNIVFDMGNVILRWDPDYIASKLSNNDNEKDIIKLELFASDNWALLDAGKISLDEVVASFKKEHFDLLKHALYHWYDYFEPIEAMIPVVKDLKERGYHLYLLSNCNIQFDEYYQKVTAFNYFDDFYLSAKHQLVKPDIAIFKDFLQEFNLQAHESVFIDDMLENVNGAKQTGMEAYLFNGDIEALKRYLKSVLK